MLTDFQILFKINPPVASVAVRSKAVVLSLLIHCLFLLPLFVGDLCLILVLLCIFAVLPSIHLEWEESWLLHFYCLPDFCDG